MKREPRTTDRGNGGDGDVVGAKSLPCSVYPKIILTSDLLKRSEFSSVFKFEQKGSVLSRWILKMEKCVNGYQHGKETLFLKLSDFDFG